MKIVAISDTHLQHRQLTVPDGDVLIHCGDFSNRGSFLEFNLFLDWFSAQPHEHRIFIAGNHDVALQKEATLCQRLLKEYDVHYLEDSGIQINGVNFWGTPWQPEFYNWAFNLPKDGERMKSKWDLIPQNTDVLILHGPPYGCLDTSALTGENIGSTTLLNKICEVKPEVVLCGHNHSKYGHMNLLETTNVYNVSSCNERYDIENSPVVINISR